MCTKPPFGGPIQVVRCLARHTHRVLIASHCIFTLVDGTVTFRYIDCAGANHEKSLAQPTTDVTPGLRSP